MSEGKYHGSFDHPVRAFVIGVTLLVLLFGGFVVGVEASSPHPLAQAAVRTVGTRLSVHTVTTTVPAVTRTIGGHTRVVPFLSTRLVVIHRHGKTIVVVEPAPPSSDTTGPLSALAPTVFTVPASTVTEPGSTVTVTEPPVTVTVTEPGTTDTTATSNVSTSTSPSSSSTP